MTRITALTGALAGVLLLLAPTVAGAQWRDGGRGYGRYGGGGGRGGYAPSASPSAFRGGGGDARYAWPGPGQGRYSAPAGYGGRPRGGEGGGWRRGQVLPQTYRDAYVPDPGRYHLRAPPPGYGWVGDGRNAYLTQRSTGMVLDSVPGAYEPAPAYGRGRGRRGPR